MENFVFHFLLISLILRRIKKGKLGIKKKNGNENKDKDKHITLSNRSTITVTRKSYKWWPQINIQIKDGHKYDKLSVEVLGFCATRGK